MSDTSIQARDRPRALIYCRVSSPRQRLEGAGLDSQEHLCRKYAEDRGYEVEAVFPDDITGGGDFMKRPGMAAMFAYLDAQRERNYAVIFDDPKRLARDTEFHMRLRRELAQRGATVECPNFTFEDTPEGKFIETIIAAQGQLEREQNARQVIQKMKARVEKGYWVFRAPVGYRYAPDNGGKKLVIDPAPAAAVRAGLEGFASGRFRSQAELKRYLEDHPDFPADLPGGGLRPQTIVRLLGKIVYAGYVNAPSWNIAPRKGVHTPLISLETYERIQARLKEGTYAPARKDVAQDFILRGAVRCACCNTLLTAGWSTGKTKTYPYYLCREKGCALYGKSIPRQEIEERFEGVLVKIQPNRTLAKVAGTLFRQAWDLRASQMSERAASFKAQIAETEKTISGLVERVLQATQPRVLEAYEQRIAELERHKRVLAEKSANIAAPKHTFDEMFELSMRMLSSPWTIWKNGGFEVRKAVLRPAFCEELRYDRENGFRTPKTTLPFKVLANFDIQKCKMVPPERLELPTH
ncbi:recombinase family protein [Pontivivens ytuae]|uniref:Recombinase family protein n=1 Tax=Pontivivens ytuae TaxID=2789856 RepID=A0A7S9LVJ6_9RHOB|nr:recombinase family protein [Pontivivens ytuae]